MKRILIIEDDPVVLGIYRNRYATHGFTVQAAMTGEDGLKRVKSFKPDLIQLDLGLPDKNGVEIIRAVRDDPELKHIPIFVLTTGYLTHMVQKAWDAGANKVLTKADCTPAVMVDVVKKYFEQAGAPAAAPAASSPPPGGTAFITSGQTAFLQRPDAAAAGGAAFFYPVPVPTAPVPALAPGADEEAMKQELRTAFRDSVLRETAALRPVIQALGKGGEAAVAAVTELRRKAHQLAVNAEMCVCRRSGRLAAALEALLKDLQERPDQVTPSIIRTLAQAVDHLARAVESIEAAEAAAAADPRVLVVDDEQLSRKAVTVALQKVGLKCLSVGDPNAALGLLEENRFDLIILDVDMPEMDGFELCKKIRAQPAQKDTPIVFVTSLSGFDSRAKSTLSGGNDLIAKPFLFPELGLKALIHLHKTKA
jgi:CheY-like chemotaxis protein